MNTIVVGVDGSRTSLAALRYAVREARLRGDRVRIVTAWQVPAVAYGGAFAPSAPDSREFQRGAEDTLAEALAVAAEEDPGVPAEAVLREGDAAHVLLEESKGADGLVVGCHDYSFVRGLFHHSVSGECAHEARCPVTVVHES
jgi:nucleotide-binding universal stress UspA family protein